MWGLIIGVCILVVAIGLRIDGKVGDVSFSALLTLALVSGIAIAYFGSTKKLKAGLDGIELETFREEVSTIKEEASNELKREVTVHREAIAGLIEKANGTREELERVAKEAAPPILSLEQQEIKQVDGEYEVKLILKPSKNALFAYLVFHAEIFGNTEASVQKFGLWEMHAWFPPDKLTEISDDGKKATIRYLPVGGIRQRLFLRVSASCRVRITGNRLDKPLEFEVK